MPIGNFFTHKASGLFTLFAELSRAGGICQGFERIGRGFIRGFLVDLASIQMIKIKTVIPRRIEPRGCGDVGILARESGSKSCPHLRCGFSPGLGLVLHKANEDVVGAERLADSRDV